MYKLSHYTAALHRSALAVGCQGNLSTRHQLLLSTFQISLLSVFGPVFQHVTNAFRKTREYLCSCNMNKVKTAFKLLKYKFSAIFILV